MGYTLIGLFLSAVFGISVLTILGPDALSELPWVDWVFWALFGVGLTLNAIDNAWDVRWVVCKFSQKVDEFVAKWLFMRRHCMPYICDCEK